MNLPSHESRRSFRACRVPTHPLASIAKTTPRPAFTLVELMMVIVIIGLLAGLAIPAIMRAVTSAKEGAYKQEVDTLADAVEKYRTKYGDYPPDGSSWQIMERHLRKAFPQIQQSELNLLNPTTATALTSQGWSGDSWTLATGFVAGIRNDFDVRVAVGPNFGAADMKVMDPAEALVFFLGGFSSNPKQPFTGPGGPFLTSAGQWEYNPQRTNAFFEFKSDRLTIAQVNSSSGPKYVSVDETAFHGIPNDLLPVYLNKADIENSSPFVYFDSRTYVIPKTMTAYFNFYQRFSTSPMATTSNDRHGSIRPLMSSSRRAPAPAFDPTPMTVAERINHVRQHLFMEDQKFQVIGSGIDGIYGGMLSQEITALATFQQQVEAYLEFPSGRSYYADPAGPSSSWTPIYTRLLRGKASAADYDKHVMSTGQLDNAANCTERTFLNTLKAPGQ